LTATNGTASYSPTGPIKGTYYFTNNNTTLYLSLTTAYSSQIFNNSFTISCWLYAKSGATTNPQFIFESLPSSSPGPLTISINTSTRILAINYTSTGNIISILSGTNFDNILNKWQHFTFCISYSSDNSCKVIVYKNGSLLYSSTSLTVSYPISNITNFKIGYYLQGYLSDYRFYNQILTQVQVWQLYAGSVKIIYGDNYTIGSGGGGGGGSYLNDVVGYSNIFATGSNIITGGQYGVSNIYALVNYGGSNAYLNTGGRGGGIGTTVNIMGTNNPIAVGIGGNGGSSSYTPVSKLSLYGYGADGNSSNAIGGPGIIIIKIPYSINTNINSNIIYFDNKNTSIPIIGTVGGIGDKIIIATAKTFNNFPDYPFSIGYYSSNLWYSVPSWGTTNWFIGGKNAMNLTNDVSYLPYSYDSSSIYVNNPNTTITSTINQLSVGSPGNASAIILYDGNNGNYPNSGNVSSGVASSINSAYPSSFTSNSWRILASTVNNIDNFYTKFPYSTLSFTYGPNANNDYNNILTGGGDNGNIHMYLTGGGQLYVYDDIISFNSASDMKLKENVKKMSDSLTIISKFNPVEFSWKNINEVIERKRTTVDYGFIAQEVEKKLTHLVHEGNDYKVIKYEKIVPFLVKGMQELNERLLAIEKKLNIIE